ncbi:MAG: alginate lyase family protein [Pseudomonadota bacterium]
MKMQQLSRFITTVKFLTCKQIAYRLFYTLRNRLRYLQKYQHKLLTASRVATLTLQPSIHAYPSCDDNRFTFLNLSKTFDTTIDWNYSQYGKLWTYNLTYFDFLHQEEMSKEKALELIHNFIDQSASIHDGFEPFPISLRGINWIKFLVKHEISDVKINDSLFAHYHILLDNQEYHLLGNHLLENGFSLLFGAYYFHDDSFYKTANKILTAQIEEQILPDGAHFELSPMYHQIMLYRVLDCINLLKNNLWKDKGLLTLLESKAQTMLGWLEAITYGDGAIPLLNDSTNGIAPTTKELTQYAALLGLQARHLPLKESGYRKIAKETYECIVDVGNIGPDYIPGHAHSDTFNFELHIDGKPIIIDTGLSTYETNARRNTERSTSSHNTVMIDDKEQSEVWGGFRVARRAKITDLHEDVDWIEATHDGYTKIGVLHTRQFSFENHKIIIRDTIQSATHHHCIAFLHLHPDVLVRINHDTAHIGSCSILFTEYQKIELDTYQYAPEFNTLIEAFVIKITFTKNLTMEITL